MARPKLSLIGSSSVTAKMQPRTADMCAVQKIGRLLRLSGSGRSQTYQSDSAIVEATNLLAQQQNKAFSSQK